MDNGVGVPSLQFLDTSLWGIFIHREHSTGKNMSKSSTNYELTNNKKHNSNIISKSKSEGIETEIRLVILTIN